MMGIVQAQQFTNVWSIQMPERLKYMTAIAAIVGCMHTPERTRTAAAPRLPSQEAGTVERIASYWGLGGQFGMVVAPGAESGSERLYVSFLYDQVTLEVVGFDPDTGASTVFRNPIPGEIAARTMVRGPDENLYLGTIPTAHLLKLTTAEGRLLDLGRPSPTEQFIWELTFGSDGKLYGGTDPNAKLVRFDPATGALEDLGRMDPEEHYARHVAASDDGFIYVAVGSSRENVAAYEIATGRHREILPANLQVPGITDVFRATDGHVYVEAGTSFFVARGWNLDPTEQRFVGQRPPSNRARDGRSFALEGHDIVATDVHGKVTRNRFDYQGNAMGVFRLGLGPDEQLYASTSIPARLIRIDEPEHRITDVAELGDGQVYSFLSSGDALLMAGYATIAPLMSFVRRSVHQTHIPDEDLGWRPIALLKGPRSKVYIGAIAGYGKLDGWLCEWDVATGHVDTVSPIAGQSISSLARWKELLVIGTAISGGTGSHPTATDAKILLWNPKARAIEREIEIVGVARIDNLAVDQDRLYVLGGGTMFVVQIPSGTITHRVALPFAGNTLWSSLERGPDGNFWGLAPDGIFAITPASNDVKLITRSPEKITAGFVLRGNMIYFASAANVYRYAIPSLLRR